MIKYLNIAFPKQANNIYNRNNLAVWGFYPILAIYIFRSFMHLLSETAGLVPIATIKPLPLLDNIDPNNLVYLFASLWGASQVIITLLIILIFFRYRSLMSIIWLIVIVDIPLRLVSGYIHPLTPEYYINTPPGQLYQTPILIYALIMFMLSLKEAK